MTTQFTLFGGVFLMLSFGLADDPPDAIAKAPSRFAKIKEMRVHYKSLGDGTTALVFVHGWTADMNSWRYQVPAFNGKIRILLIDLPGHGESDKPKIDYTMELFARSIEAVLKDAGVEKAVLVGHSMGTPVIREFQRLFPEKTAALVAVDGGLRRPTLKQEDLDRFVGRFAGADYEAQVGKFVEAMLSNRTPAEVRKMLKALPRAPQHVAVSAMKAMWDPAAWKEDKIPVPLLVIVAKSPFWTADYEQYVRKLSPQVDYRVMEDAGHFLMLERPEAFNTIVAEFLRKHQLLK